MARGFNYLIKQIEIMESVMNFVSAEYTLPIFVQSNARNKITYKTFTEKSVKNIKSFNASLQLFSFALEEFQNYLEVNYNYVPMYRIDAGTINCISIYPKDNKKWREAILSLFAILKKIRLFVLEK